MKKQTKMKMRDGESGTNIELEYKPLIVGGSGFINTESRGSVALAMNMVSEQSSEWVSERERERCLLNWIKEVEWEGCETLRRVWIAEWERGGGEGFKLWYVCLDSG